jgi:dienelactone hydrolase
MEEMYMKTPEWLKPGLYGTALGAVALAIVGFSWGGWMTGGAAGQMASNQARLEVVAALAPICVEQSKQDPQVAETLALLKDASSYQRSDMLMKAGWATMPGSSDPNRYVASACMDTLAAEF